MDIDHFVDDVINNPNDMSLRLVFADYLDEIGDPRGELIRLQLRLAGMTELDADWHELSPQRATVAARPHSVWQSPSRRHDPRHLRRVHDSVSIVPEQFPMLHDELFRGAPIRRLTLPPSSEWKREKFDSPHLGQLRSLTISPNSKVRNLAQVLSSDQWMGLEELHLESENISEHVLAAVAKNSAFANLKRLKIDGQRCQSPREVQALAKSTCITGLSLLRYPTRRMRSAKS